jgi:inner membrane protein
MDNPTHTAVAFFLSRIGPGRWSPYATPIILVAANLPDIDIVSWFGGGLNYLHFHRNLTHAIAAMPLIALAAVGIVRLIARKPVVWLGAFFAALLAVASHLALDATNVYGIRLLLPFSNSWQGLDTTPVVDLSIWAVCLLAVAAPLLGRLVGSEIASTSVRPKHYGRGWAWLAIGFVLSYNVVRFGLHSRAVTALSSQLYQDSVALRVGAMPSANPLKWRGLIETANAVTVQDIDLAGASGATHTQIFHKPEAEPAIDAAGRSGAFRQFLEFAQWPLWRVTPYPARENARLVEVFDMRFGTPVEPGFMVAAVVDSRNRVIESRFQFGGVRIR